LDPSERNWQSSAVQWQQYWGCRLASNQCNAKNMDDASSGSPPQGKVKWIESIGEGWMDGF
jgi:hypothetical protein